MKPIYKSIAIGCAIETFFGSLFAYGGFGPCGPSNAIGFIGMLGHVFPGMLVLAGMGRFLDLPGSLTIVVFVLSQAMFWSAITFTFMKVGNRLDRLDANKPSE